MRRTYPVCPRYVAWCKGARPRLSLWLTSAPFCSRNSQAIKEPWQSKEEFCFQTHPAIPSTYLPASCLLSACSKPESRPPIPKHNLPATSTTYPHHGLNQRSFVFIFIVHPVDFSTMSQGFCHERQVSGLCRLVDQQARVQLPQVLQI